MKKIFMLFLISFGIFAKEYVREEKISGIREIYINGAAEAKIVQGSKESLEIKGKESLIKDIEIKVRGSYLEIKIPKKSYFTSKENVVIEISIDDLKEIEFQGAGKMLLDKLSLDKLLVRIDGTGTTDLKDVDIKDLSIEVNGKSNMTASGETKNLTAFVDGIGSFKAFDLEAKKADIKLNGVGSVEVMVEDNLSAKVNGVGKIIYKGNPAIEENQLNGLGQIKKYEE